jgi:hypothetical protein
MDVILLTSGPNNRNRSETAYRYIGAYKIANSCRKVGFDAQVIDHLVYFSKDEIITALRRFITPTTLVIGISTTFIAINNQIPSHVLEALAVIKQEFPYIKLAFGGYGHLATRLNQTVCPDAIIYGYAEDIFVELVSYYAGKGQEPVGQLEFPIGGKFRTPYKAYKSARDAKFDIETDEFRFTHNDFIMPGETLPIEISRGCIFKCKFCNHLLLGRGKLDYLKSMELVRNELIYNYETFGTTNYYVICDTFNDTEVKMKYWHDMILSLPFKIKYGVYLRADLLHRFPDVPYMLAETGLFAAFHGIESFNNTAAVAVGKGWSAKHGKEYLPQLYHDIWKGDIFQTISFIAGLPGDTPQDNHDAVDWFIANDMYHMSINPLGLVANKNAKNASEFERNAEQYGYRYIDPGNPDENGNGAFGYWENDTWNQRIVAKFLEDEILPKLMKHNARRVTWDIMHLLQYGYTKESFLKINSQRLSDTASTKSKAWVEAYKARVLGKD